jgi:hypothetical protein
MKGFSVCYEIVTPESAEDGEAAATGFFLEDVSLRDALAAVRALTPSSDPFDAEDARLWYTEIDPDRNWRTGEEETRSLHLPRNLTSSTRRRIARLLGVSA